MEFSIRFTLLYIAIAIGLANGIQKCVEDEYSPSALVLDDGADLYKTITEQGHYSNPLPKFVVQVKSKRQIAAVVKCASDAGLEICERVGWENGAGPSPCAGVLVDVSPMTRHNYNNTYGNSLVTTECGKPTGEMYHAIIEESFRERFMPIAPSLSEGACNLVASGGISPYSARLDIMCRSVRSVKYVLADGSFVRAALDENPELFMASCGAGGGLFGVMYEATLQTHSKTIPDFDKNVNFRYEWPKEVAGQLIRSLLDYEVEEGHIWLRVEVSGEGSIAVVGTCFEALSVSGCEGRLSKGAFFKIPGRDAKIRNVGNNEVSSFQKFISPVGENGNKIPKVSESQAFMGTRGKKEKDLDRSKTFISRIYRWPTTKPSAELWQKIANSVFDSDKSSTILRMSLYQAREKSGWLLSEPEYAYAHRSADGMVQVISDDGVENIVDVLDKNMKSWLSGIYPGYGGSEEVDDKNYLFWGSSLPKLVALRKKLDPKGLFNNKLGFPSEVSCPGKLSVSGSGSKRSVSLDVNYKNGQLSGMRTEFTASGAGCGDVKLLDNQAIKDVPDGWVGIIFDGPGPATVKIKGGLCTFKVKTINGISC